jgi:hypothetical protein
VGWYSGVSQQSTLVSQVAIWTTIKIDKGITLNDSRIFNSIIFWASEIFLAASGIRNHALDPYKHESLERISPQLLASNIFTTSHIKYSSIQQYLGIIYFNHDDAVSAAVAVKKMAFWHLTYNSLTVLILVQFTQTVHTKYNESHPIEPCPNVCQYPQQKSKLPIKPENVRKSQF